ncbi:MAG: 2'-5' RNA ligase family protein [Bryobacteraceae bacterium]
MDLSPVTPVTDLGCLDSFALVTYLPESLRLFLDDLRLSLEPNAVSPRAHVTVLPPRPLAKGATLAQAGNLLAEKLPRTSFEIAVGGVEVFADTRVIYLALDAGWDELQGLHRLLNTGALAAADRFAFHPHVTLAQNLGPADAAGLAEVASAAWARFSGPRRFWVENFTLVQNTTELGWRDLVEYPMLPTPALPGPIR